jgi:hypothetical protein
MVLVTDGNSTLEFGLAGADTSSHALVDGSRITYPGVKPGMDLVYEVRAGQVKEYVILSSAPTEPLVLDFPLTLGDMSVSELGSGAFGLLTPSNALAFQISDLWMLDSATTSAEPAFSEDVAASLVGGGTTLRLTPDHGWLTSAERVYPVTIDPTITKYTNDDTYVQSNICCTDVSGETEMKSGTYDGGATNDRRREAIRVGVPLLVLHAS